MSAPVVSVIILNWNGLQDTIECLESLKAVTYPGFQTIVVDNGSSGDDVRQLRERYGNSIDIIANDKNRGFTGGNNTGIQHAVDHYRATHIILLNNDAIVDPGFIDGLLEAIESGEQIGIAGAKIYFFNSNRIQFVYGTMNMWLGQPGYTPYCIADRLRSAPVDRGQYDQQKTVEWVSGCCMMIKVPVIQKIGALDESFFAYFEDIEYCIRATGADYAIVYAPRAKVWHKGARSTSWNSSFATYLNIRNRLKFMRKYSSTWRNYIFLAFFFGIYVPPAIVYYVFIKRDRKLVTEFLRGVKDGVWG